MNNVQKTHEENQLRHYYALTGKMASRGMMLKARRGVAPGCAPVGYKNLRGSIVIDEEKAPLVRHAFALAAEGEHSLRAILAVLPERGLKSRNGKPIGASALWGVLTNPFYAGKIRYKGELLPGTHKPLVSEGIFGEAQRRLQERRRR